MRSFFSILVLFAVSLVVAALLAYPVWLLVDQQPVHRVMHRVAELCALAGLIWLFRRWKMFTRDGAGLSLSRSQFWMQLVAGLISGTLIILPLLVTLEVLDVRIADARVTLTPLFITRVLAAGLTTGLLVALIEEIFFRGLLFTAVERESGRFLAILLPNLLYAFLHFLDGRLHIPADQIEWSSGLAVLTSMFHAYSDPLQIVDSFLALFAVGVLLAIVRARTGAIAACIGLHAAWVCALYYIEVTTQFNPASAASWLVGSYDNTIGWGTVAWMATMACVYVMVARTTRSSSTQPARQTDLTADRFPAVRLPR